MNLENIYLMKKYFLALEKKLLVVIKTERMKQTLSTTLIFQTLQLKKINNKNTKSLRKKPQARKELYLQKPT